MIAVYGMTGRRTALMDAIAVLGALLAVASCAAAIRTRHVGVEINDDGLQFRGVWTTRVLRWADERVCVANEVPYRPRIPALNEYLYSWMAAASIIGLATERGVESHAEGCASRPHHLDRVGH